VYKYKKRLFFLIIRLAKWGMVDYWVCGLISLGNLDGKVRLFMCCILEVARWPHLMYTGCSPNDCWCCPSPFARYLPNSIPILGHDARLRTRPPRQQCLGGRTGHRCYILCIYIYTYSWGFEAIIVLSLLKRIRYFANTMLANPIPFLNMVYNSPKWWKFCVKRE